MARTVEELRLASVPAAAVRYGVDRTTINRGIKSGTITAYGLTPRTTRVDLNELDAKFGIEPPQDDPIAAALAAAGARLAEEAPDLTPSQIDRIVSVLRPSLKAATAA